MGIIVVSERTDDDFTESSRDTISIARKIARRLGTWSAPLIVGGDEVGLESTVSRCGTDAAFHARGSHLSDNPAAWAEATLDLVARTEATAIVAANTDWGNAVLAEVAARSNVPVIQDCVEVDATSDGWLCSDSEGRQIRDIGSGLKLVTFDYPTAVVGVAPPRVMPFDPEPLEDDDLVIDSQPSDSVAFLTIMLCAVSVFLVALELTVISLALPDLAAHFPSSPRSSLGWIFTSYNVGVASLLLLFGWAAERFGRKRLFLLGLGIFMVGSVITGAAPTLGVLIAGRSVQSVGGAMLLPSSLALIMAGTSDEKRNAAIGVWGSTAGLAAAIGPTLGALLVNYAGWRSIFFLNVPIALAALLIGSRVLVETSAPDAPRKVDWAAPPLCALGAGLLVYAISRIEQQGLSDTTTLIAMSVSLLLLAMFALRTVSHEAPLFPKALATQRTYAVGQIGTGLFAVAFASWLVLFPTFLVQVWNYSILEAGFGTALAPLIMALVAGPAGALSQRVGLRPVITMGLLMAVFGTLYWIVMIGSQPNYLVDMLAGAVLFGIGLGVAVPMLTAASLRDVEPRSFAVAAAGNTTCRQIAMAIGISVAVAIVGSGVPTVESFKISWGISGALSLIAAVVVAVTYPNAAESQSET